MYKKALIYCTLCITISICSVLTLIKWDREVQKKQLEDQQIVRIEEVIEYNKLLPTDTVRLKRTASGKIQEMTMDEYLVNVVASEMPPYYELEALKAQAIVARTYAYEKLTTGVHGDCDICDNYAHCQAYYDLETINRGWEAKGYDEKLRKEYWGKVKQAVYETSRIVITYKGEYIKAYFHANSGGRTEDVSQIWGKQTIPYLLSVESNGEEAHDYYKTEESFTVSKLQNILNGSYSRACQLKVAEENGVKILSYTTSGRVKNVEIGGAIYSAEELRVTLGLKSTNFTATIKDGIVTFHVTGFGHGVGMSQTGANYYATDGKKATEIIQHYYSNVSITKLVTKEEEKKDE